MKNVILLLGVSALLLSIVGFGLYPNLETGTEAEAPTSTPGCQARPAGPDLGTAEFAISHGHCMSLFPGTINDLKIGFTQQDLSDLTIDFIVEAKSFVKETQESKTIEEELRLINIVPKTNKEIVSFTCTSSIQLGKRWLQLNGDMEIGGVTVPTRLRAVPVFNASDSDLKEFVITGNLDLLNFGNQYGLQDEFSPEPMSRAMKLNLIVKVPDHQKI